MRRRAAAAFIAAAVLAGCATKPATKTAPQQDPAEALLARALTLVEQSSSASLAESSKTLASPELVGSAKSKDLASLAGFLFSRLYPEMADPFGASDRAAANTPVVGDFFQTIAPALALLQSDSLSAAQLDGFAAQIQTADAMRPNSVLPPYLQALRLERGQGDPSAILARYEACLQRDPSFYPAARRISEILIMEGKGVAELARLERLASLLPTAQLRFAALARAELAGGQPQKAADAAAQGLLAAPDDADFVILRARALEAMGNWYQSLWLLDALLKLNPNEPDAILMEARLVAEKEHNSAEAVSLLLDAEGRFPQEASFPEMRGSILMEAGKTEEALSALTRALSLDPGRVSTLTLLLRQAVRARSWDSAASWLSQLPAPALTEEHLMLGWQAATGLGDYAKAIEYAQDLEKRTESAPALALEARSMVSAGQLDKARVVVDHALLAMEASPTLRAELFVIRSTAGSEDSLRDLRSALMEDPNNVEALVTLSDQLTKQQEYRKALAYAKRAAELSPDDNDLAQKVTDLQNLAGAGE